MKKFLFIIGMFMISQVKSYSFSGIVFWEYNKNDSYDIITSKTYNELRKEKQTSIFLSFNDCSKYDRETFEFYYTDKEILEDKIQLKDFELGNEFFSIVINDTIVLTGLNRLGYFGAKMLREDDQNRLYICWLGDDIKRFKLTTDYTAAVNMCLNQKEDLEKICAKKIDEYFFTQENKNHIKKNRSFL